MDPHWTNIAAFCISMSAMLIALFAAAVSYIVYRSQSDPEVIVYPEADTKRPSLINLVIENVGKAGARDVTFTSSGDIPSHAFGLELASAKKADKMSDGPLVRGIPFLPPGGKRILTWGQYAGLLKSLGEGSVSVTAEYHSTHLGLPWRITHRTTCPLEIVSFEATDSSDTNFGKQIAKNVEKLTKAVESVAKSVGKRNG